MSTQSRILCSLLATAALLAAAGGTARAEDDGGAASTETLDGAMRAMDEAVDAYVAFVRDLAADKADALAKHGEAIAGALRRARNLAHEDKDAPTRTCAATALDLWLRHREAMTRDLEGARKHLHALSKPFVRYVGRHRAKAHRWRTFYCSMAPGSWLQAWADDAAANPYYGAKMLRCGDKVRTHGE